LDAKHTKSNLEYVERYPCHAIAVLENSTKAQLQVKLHQAIDEF